MAVTVLYPIMDHLSIKLYIFFSVIESVVVIKLIWAKNAHLYCSWHFEFTGTTTSPLQIKL